MIEPTPQVQEQRVRTGPTLELRVIRKDSGAPVPDCAVTINESAPRDTPPGSTPPFSAEGKTDADGRASFHVPAALSLDLEVGTWVRGSDANSRNSFGMQSMSLDALAPEESRELIVELPFGHDLHFWGKLVSSVDGTAISGARVSWSEAEFTTPKEKAVAPSSSDAEGFFEISVPSWDPGLAQIRAEGFGFALARPASGHEVRELALELRLTPSASVDVQVNDHTAGATAPIAVEIYTSTSQLVVPEGGYTNGGYTSGDKRWSATCDGAGRCVLASLPARAPLRVELKRGGALVMQIAERLVLEPGEQRRVEWTIGSGSTLSGRVVDQYGAAVMKRKMWLVQRDGSAGGSNSGPCYFSRGDGNKAFGTATTDDEGRFAYHELPTGAWWLGPAMTRGVAEPADANDVAAVATVIETSSGTNQSIVLSVDRGLFIRGKIVDPEGRPVPRAFISAWSISMRGLPQGFHSNDEGSFIIGPLASTPHLVQAFATGEYTAPEPVTATPNGPPIVLQLRVGGRFAGRVVDSATGLGVRARVSMTPLGSHGWMGGSSTDADGSFELDSLAPGNYDIAAMTDDARVGIERGVLIVAGGKPPNVEIRLEPGAHVTIRYKGSADHVSAFVYSGTTIVESDGIRTGTQRTFVAPAGHLRIEILSGVELKESRELDLVASETREVAFELP